MACLAEMGLKVLMKAERLLALKPRERACARPASAKPWKVVANYEVFCRGENGNYPISVFCPDQKLIKRPQTCHIQKVSGIFTT